MTDNGKRRSNGGRARDEKLTKEEKHRIASEAAKARWAEVRRKKAESEKPKVDPVVAAEETGIHAEDAGLEPTVWPTYGGIERSMPMLDPNTNPPAVPFQAVPRTLPIPVVAPIYIPPPPTLTPVHPEPPKPVQKRKNPIPKAFKGASSYADKRLAEAIKERAECMGRVAALNAEIPSLVAIIRALGMTPNMNGYQDFTAQIPPMNGYPDPVANPYAAPVYQPISQQPQVEIPPPPNIDPALYATNNNPVPGLAPAIANAPVITNKALGGAMDLDFVPTDEEGPALPKMGGGWA